MLEIVIIAIGLAMDAFSVSLVKGLCIKHNKLKNGLIISTFFGGFQGIMFLLGYKIGLKLPSQLFLYGNILAFLLLFIIGLKMLIEAIKNKDEAPKEYSLNLLEITFLAIATSIDSLAVGISFALIGSNLFIIASFIIGIITFFISLFGIFLGNKIGVKWNKKAEILGGVILILIALKILA